MRSLPVHHLINNLITSYAARHTLLRDLACIIDSFYIRLTFPRLTTNRAFYFHVISQICFTFQPVSFQGHRAKARVTSFSTLIGLFLLPRNTPIVSCFSLLKCASVTFFFISVVITVHIVHVVLWSTEIYLRLRLLHSVAGSFASGRCDASSVFRFN